jgi:hypothetical protein
MGWKAQQTFSLLPVAGEIFLRFRLIQPPQSGGPCS